jgi:hypothetical protein
VALSRASISMARKSNRPGPRSASLSGGTRKHYVPNDFRRRLCPYPSTRNRMYPVAQRSLLAAKCIRARNDGDHTVMPVASLAGTKGRGDGQMISAVECREHAVECRQMSERAPSLRVRDILIDMARSWERLALETDHSAPTSPKIVLRHQLRRES